MRILQGTIGDLRMTQQHFNLKFCFFIGNLFWSPQLRSDAFLRTRRRIRMQNDTKQVKVSGVESLMRCFLENLGVAFQLLTEKHLLSTMLHVKSVFILISFIFMVWGRAVSEKSVVSEKEFGSDFEDAVNNLQSSESKMFDETNTNNSGSILEDETLLNGSLRERERGRNVRQVMLYPDFWELPQYWRNVLLPQTRILTGVLSRGQNQTVAEHGSSKNKKVDANYHGNRRRLVTCYTKDRRTFDGFACDSENCVPLDWVCDGDYDCETGADEEYCHSRQCPNGQLRCLARGRFICLSVERLCDGHIDCHDGSDENQQICRNFDSGNRICRNGFFRCRNGRGCIPANEVCDFEEDCEDGSDENQCPIPSHLCRSELHFPCFKSFYQGRHPKCVPKIWVCDGREDCPRGEDESLEDCQFSNTVARTRNVLLPVYGTELQYPVPFFRGI